MCGWHSFTLKKKKRIYVKHISTVTSVVPAEAQKAQQDELCHCSLGIDLQYFTTEMTEKYRTAMQVGSGATNILVGGQVGYYCARYLGGSNLYHCRRDQYYCGRVTYRYRVVFKLYLKYVKPRLGVSTLTQIVLGTPNLAQINFFVLRTFKGWVQGWVHVMIS